MKTFVKVISDLSYEELTELLSFINKRIPELEAYFHHFIEDEIAPDRTMITSFMQLIHLKAAKSLFEKTLDEMVNSVKIDSLTD